MDYADRSVEQQRQNIGWGCGYEGIRWHEWWDAHHGWCKDWVSETQVEGHLELRQVQLRKCRREDDRFSRRERY